MAVRVVSYDTEAIPQGNRIPVLNGDDPIRFDSLDDINNAISNNASNISSINSTIGAIQSNSSDMNDRIVDNTNRINNLEDVDHIQKFIQGLDAYSSKVIFTNAIKIEIPHNRKEIYFKKVVSYVGTIENEEQYEEITSSVKITDVIIRDSQGNIIGKKIVIYSNQPITGYFLYI